MAISAPAPPRVARAESHENHLVGRDGVIAKAIDALDAPQSRHVLVAGPSGAGTTAVLEHLADDLCQRGRIVVAPDESELARLAFDPGHDADLVGGRRDRDDHAIVVIDDLGSLNAQAAAAVERLDLERECLVLASVRRVGSSIPEIACTLGCRRDVTWIELDNFTLDELDDFVSRDLGGPLDRSSVHALHDLTSGNPGQLAKLIAPGSAPASCFAETDGLWRCDVMEAGRQLGHDPVMLRRLVAGPEMRRLVGFVARMGHTSLGLLMSHFEPDVIEDAERQSFIVATPEQAGGVMAPDAVRVDLGGALDAPTVARVESPEERRAVDDTITAAATSDATPELVAAVADVLVRKPRLDLDDIDVVLDAASDAVDRADPEQAWRLVRRLAEDHDAAPAHEADRRRRQVGTAHLIAAHSLDRLGRNEEALDVLTRAEGIAVDQRTRALIAIRRSMILARLNDDQALEALDESNPSSLGGRALLDIQRASLLLHAGHVEGALDLAERHASQHPEMLGEAIVVLGPGLAVNGQPLRGLEFVQRARAAAPTGPAPLHVSDGGMIDIIEALCLTEAGMVSAAVQAARVRYEDAVASGDRWRQAWYALNLGRIGLLAGSSIDALRSFTESAVAFADVDHPGYRTWALAGAAGAAARLGDAAGARMWADAYDGADPHDVRLYEPDSERLRAAADRLCGDDNAAVARLDAALAAAHESGQRTPESAIAFDLILARQTVPASTIATLEDDTLEGDLNAARRAFVVAASAGELDDLATAAERFEAVGCLVPAIDVWRYAAGEFGAAGIETERRRCVRAANALIASESRGGTPDRSDAVAGCTARELQVARLAVRGWERRTIAAQLFISPRTVDRHLNAVFAKVGVTNRAELADVLLDRPASHENDR